MSILQRALASIVLFAMAAGLSFVVPAQIATESTRTFTRGESLHPVEKEPAPSPLIGPLPLPQQEHSQSKPLSPAPFPLPATAEPLSIEERYAMRVQDLSAAYDERLVEILDQAYNEYLGIVQTDGKVARLVLAVRYIIQIRELERDYDRDFEQIAREMAAELTAEGRELEPVARAAKAHVDRKERIRVQLCARGTSIIENDPFLGEVFDRIYRLWQSGMLTLGPARPAAPGQFVTEVQPVSGIPTE